MPTVNELTWQSLTAAINEVKTPNSFLQTLLFSNHNTNTTETISIDAWVGGRKMAPFVHAGAEARMVDGVSQRFRTIDAPNIRIKRPFSAQQLLFSRTPGTPIFINRAQQVSEVNAHIARDIAYMRGMIDDTVEWMCAQALTGTITYNPNTGDYQLGDAFTIDFQRPASHTIVLAGADTWDQTTSNIEQDVREVKQLISDAVGLGVTDVIMGKEAADAFIANAKVSQILDNRNMTAGVMQLSNQFSQAGALFLGNLFGVNWWQYGRQVVDPFGLTVNLISPKHAHFVCAVGPAENVIEYGAIPDMQAFNGGVFVGEIFSKSWEQQDPSAVIHLVHSRPLPVTRRPESMVTMQVVP